MQERVQLPDVGLGLLDPDLLHQLDPRDGGIDGRDRRRAGLEAARVRSGRVVVDVHLEDVAVGEPACRSGRDPLHELAAAEEEAEAGGPEQVLEHPRGEEVAPERAHVDWERAHRLVGVHEDERSPLVGEPGHGLDVELASVAKTDVRHRDERRLLVDRRLEPLEGDRPVGLGGHVLDPHAAAFLCVPDLADRRELEVAHDDLVAPLPEPEPAGERAHAGRDRGRHRHLVLVGADQPGDAAAGSFELVDPVLPRRAVLVPVGEIAGVGVAHGIGECALRAAVDVDTALEEWEAVPDPSR